MSCVLNVSCVFYLSLYCAVTRVLCGMCSVSCVCYVVYCMWVGMLCVVCVLYISVVLYVSCGCYVLYVCERRGNHHDYLPRSHAFQITLCQWALTSWETAEVFSQHPTQEALLSTHCLGPKFWVQHWLSPRYSVFALSADTLKSFQCAFCPLVLRTCLLPPPTSPSKPHFGLCRA